MTLFQGFLYAHVLGAIIAFGPAFTFPIIGRLGAQEREHGNFATRISAAIAKVQVAPFAILQGITGVGLIITGNIDITAHAWLLVGIVLYLVAIGFAFLVQTPTVQRVIDMTSGGPRVGAGAGGTPAGGPSAGPSGGPPVGGPPPGGPPLELMKSIRRVQMGGLFLMALIVSIVFLMVVQPGG